MIPAFNAAETLPTALNSLRDQNFAEWEAIVVDDGSTDDTADVARKYNRHDPRIRLLSQNNRGVSAARNAGVAAARSSWLVFLDADDWVAPDYLTLLHATASKQPGAGVAYCGYFRVGSDGTQFASYWCPDIGVRPFEVFAQRSAAAIHSFLVRRDCVSEVGGFDETLSTCEDWDLWQRIARTGALFIGVPKALAYYRMRPGSLSTNLHQMVRDATRVIAQGQAPDVRVRRPAPSHAEGSMHFDPCEAAALFGLWCAATQAGRELSAVNLLNEFKVLPDLAGKADLVSDCLCDGLLVGAQLRSSNAGEVWHRAEGALQPVFELLERASSRPGLAQEISSALQRSLLDKDSLLQPRSLTNWMGLRLDIRQPITPIVPKPTVDVLYCRICCNELELGRTEIPILGTVSALMLTNLAIECTGLAAAITYSRAHRRFRFWTTLAATTLRYAHALALAVISCCRGRHQELRGIGRAVLRTSLCAALAGSDSIQVDCNNERIRRLISEEERGAGGADQPLAFPPAIPLPVRPINPLTDRKAFWEDKFVNPDPWKYEKPYEQRKYAQTLAVLGDEPVGRGLELACAEGVFTAQLAPKVETLIAADISGRALERARLRCRDSTNIEFRQLDFFDEPIPTNLDLIVCSEVLYYLKDRSDLARVAEKLRDALAPNGRLVSAHALLMIDDPGQSGFDWDHSFGAVTIRGAFSAAGLSLERSIETELYRVDLFRRDAPGSPVRAPVIEKEPLGSPLDPEVERGVVWGGAVVTRVAVANTETWRVPVLLYHQIADDGPEALSHLRLSPAKFEAQMRYLRRHGYHSITCDELERCSAHGWPICGRPVLITFDDGYRDFYEVAWPILRQFGFTATVFVPTDLVGASAGWDEAHGATAPLMTWQEISDTHAQGAQFGSHLATHSAATALSTGTLLREAARSRSVLEQKLGCEVRSVAPPYGALDERTLRLLRACGYTQVFTTEAGHASLSSAASVLPRVAIDGDDTIEAFAAKLGEWVGTDAPLVTAVIPACNAERTISETLQSVREQTYRNLDIVVVDDGSTDRTASIVEQLIRVDQRIRLIRQANAGVAAARNRGIAEARADFVAPVDADDLWRPTKIEKQMKAMLVGGSRVGLVYTWQAAIDDKGRILSTRYRPNEEGDVFKRMLLGNLIGSGSPTLMRKQAILEAGGYDPSLRARGGEGCEDLKLYIAISARYQFALVREHLTGYRKTGDRMSMRYFQMLRSYDLVMAAALEAYPQHSHVIKKGRVNYVRDLFQTALRHGHLGSALRLWLEITTCHPLSALGTLQRLMLTLSRFVAGRTGHVIRGAPRIGSAAPSLFLDNSGTVASGPPGMRT